MADSFNYVIRIFLIEIPSAWVVAEWAKVSFLLPSLQIYHNIKFRRRIKNRNTKGFLNKTKKMLNKY